MYDESGKTESVAFDFKGNLLSKKQQVISSAELKAALDNYQTYLVDWTGLPAMLSTQIFETSSEYDALNRVTQITLPENVNNERKEIVPVYNRAGALEQVRYDGAVYVENIAYNAKGQRLLIAFGNDIMTRYVYQPTTFRLIRQRSEKFTKTHTGNTITYTAVSGTSRQDDGFNFDLVGNILKILTRVTDCGITGSSLGSDALDKVFTYNSVYRLTSATGRESNTQHENDYLYADAPVLGSPNANHVQAYKRDYDYDKLGNVLQVKQLGNNAFTRNFNYHTGKNTLEKVETGSASLIEDFTYDACGNQLTAGASRNYVWNAANQLITYYNQVGSADPTIFAQYDYAGQERISKMVRTGTSANPVYERTIYIDGIFEYHTLENGTTYEKNYVHIMDDRSRIAMVRVGDQFPDDINEAITYNLENQIGSSTVRLTGTGTIIDKEEYYPFGDSSLRTFSKKRYRYVGREKDLESGLYYYGARYYCAWTCRFISVDPLATQYAQLTPYNYADNNPINDFDIDGMQDENSEKTPEGKIEDYVKIDPMLTQPVKPIVSQEKKPKKKDFENNLDFQNAQDQYNKDKELQAKFKEDALRYNQVIEGYNLFINENSDPKILELKKEIIAKEIPVYFSIEDLSPEEKRFAVTNANFNTRDDGSGYLTSIDIVYNWTRIKNLGQPGTSTLGTNKVKEMMRQKDFVSDTSSSSSLGRGNNSNSLIDKILPTMLTITWHELGHVADDLSLVNSDLSASKELIDMIKEMNKSEKKEDGPSEQIALEYEFYGILKQYQSILGKGSYNFTDSDYSNYSKIKIRY